MYYAAGKAGRHFQQLGLAKALYASFPCCHPRLLTSCFAHSSVPKLGSMAASLAMTGSSTLKVHPFLEAPSPKSRRSMRWPTRTCDWIRLWSPCPLLNQEIRFTVRSSCIEDDWRFHMADFHRALRCRPRRWDFERWQKWFVCILYSRCSFDYQKVSHPLLFSG